MGSALLSAAWRWGSSSLEALAGNQAVLGAAGWTGPSPLVAASWLAAAAIVCATPRWHVPQVAVAATPVRPLVAAASGSDLGGGDESLGSSRAPKLLSSAAFGASAATVVAGPAVGDRLWVRVVATVVGVGLALLVGRYRPAARRFGVVDSVALLAGVAALVLVAANGPTLAGILDVDAATSGFVIAASVVAAVSVASLGWALRRRLPSAAPVN